jgi:hypothetical protein
MTRKPLIAWRLPGHPRQAPGPLQVALVALGLSISRAAPAQTVSDPYLRSADPAELSIGPDRDGHTHPGAFSRWHDTSSGLGSGEGDGAEPLRSRTSYGASGLIAGGVAAAGYTASRGSARDLGNPAGTGAGPSAWQYKDPNIPVYRGPVEGKGGVPGTPGPINSPSVVPEPSGLELLVLGGLPLLTALRRRRQ